MSYQSKKAVFLDRDGTINPDSGFINDPAEFDVYPFAPAAIRLLNEHGFLVFVVTNQSGIARGFIEPENLEKIHGKLVHLLAGKDASIDKIYTAPYHRDGSVEPYNIDHSDRKPRTGMFRQASADFDFDPQKSFMVGDRFSDIMFGINAGLKTILVRTGDGDQETLRQLHRADRVKPHFIVRDLLSAAKFIVAFQE